MQTNTTRRALLKAVPLASIAFAIPAVAVSAISTDRAAWNAAFAAYQQVKAEDAAFTPGHAELWKRCKADCERIPHVTLRPAPYSGHREPITTADAFFVASARRAVKDVQAGKLRFDPNISGVQEHFDLQREVAQAADERDAVIQKIRDRFGMDAADDESERLGDCLSEAVEALMDIPSPDLAALRFKLDYLLADDSSESTSAWSMSFAGQAIADFARLLPEAG